MRAGAWRRQLGVLLAATLASTAVISLSPPPAHAEAERPGNISGLMADRTAPEATTLFSGTEGTGSLGDFTYSYPIEVPPGRKGQQPTIGLDYSSAGAVHGGIAAGWSMSLPAITVDPDAGTLRSEWTGGGSPGQPRNFIDPTGQMMVRDPGLPVRSGAAGYRASNDSGFTRYEYLGEVASEQHWWRAYRSDGVVMLFGDKGKHPYSYAPLQRITDGDGHELRYNSDVVSKATDSEPSIGHPREFLLRSITYHAPGDSSAYARVRFEYAAPSFCNGASSLPAIGSRLDYQYGFARLTGTRKLRQITTWARSQTLNSPLRLVRDYSLTYTAADQCNVGSAAPFRELEGIQLTAYPPTTSAAATVLPPTRFTYGAAVSYTQDAHYEPPVAVTNLQMPETVDTVQAVGGCWSGADGGVPAGCTLAPGSVPATCDKAFCSLPSDQVGPVTPGGSGHVRTIPHQTASAQANGESVTTMWIDIDGDGRTDMLRRGSLPNLATPTNQPTTGGCTVDVYLNKGDAGFIRNHSDFRNFSLRYGMADVPVPASVGPSGAGELLCSLSRSFSRNSSGGRLGDPSQPCSGPGTGSMPAGFGSMQKVEHAFVDVNADGRPDLLSQPTASAWCPYASTSGVAPLQLLPNGSNGRHIPDWHPEVINTGLPIHAQGYLTFRQKYVYVYLNTGIGFATTPTRVRSSVGTPWPDEENSRVPQPAVFGAFSVPFGGSSLNRKPEWMQDMTGDGYPDQVFDLAAVAPGTNGGDLHQTKLTLPTAGGEQLSLSTRRFAVWQAGVGDYTARTTRGLADVNGDGLPDRLVYTGVNGAADPTTGGMLVNFNNGSGFGSQADGGTTTFSDNAADTTSLESLRVTDLAEHNWQSHPLSEQRFHRRQLVDVDYDGLDDVLYYDPEGNRAQLYLNGGGTWVKSTGVDLGVGAAFGGWLSNRGVTNEFADRADYRYRQSRKVTDINGDGLLDLVEDTNHDGSATVRYAKPIINPSAEYAAPARLMRTVKNGYGATTVVSYGSVTEAGRWAVSDIAVHPGQNEPKIETRYKYRSPAFVPGPYGQARLRGFSEIAVLEVGDPSDGADDLTTVQVHDFSQDYRGRVVKSYVVLGRDAFDEPFNSATHSGVMRMTLQTYRVKLLGLSAPGTNGQFSGARVVLPRTTISYTCSTSQGTTAQACLTSGVKVEEETTWTSRSQGAGYLMELPTRVDRSFVNADNQLELLRTDSTFNVASTSTAFNVAPASDTQSLLRGGTNTTLGTTTYAYHDAEFRLLHTRSVSDPLAERRVSRFVYHTSGSQKGQVAKAWAPEQVAKYGTAASAVGFTEMLYDPFGIFPDKMINPMGHVVRTRTDLGTGVTLESAGPGYVCPDGPDSGSAPDPAENCSFDSALYQERTTVDVDGLGRVLTVTRHPQSAAASKVIESRSYDDTSAHSSAGAEPVAMTVRRMISNQTLSDVRTELDGLGRVVRQVTSQSPHPQRVVSYDYNHRGALHVVHSPRADGQSGVVSVRTYYDPLGRVSAVNETGSGNQIFEQHTYGGLIHTIRQFTSDGSPARETRLTSDATGQLVKTEDRAGSRPDGEDDTVPVYATTSYRYDGQGRLAEMFDPDGAVTNLLHDYAGNRLRITTASGTWQYRYDRNGNLTSLTEPVPPGHGADSYTHRVQYDDINRVTVETPGTRDLTPAEQAELKIGPKTYHYDQAHASLNPASLNALYQVGRLSYTESAAVRLKYGFNPFGQPAVTYQDLPALDGLVDADTLALSQGWDAAGNLNRTQYWATSGGAVTHYGKAVEYWNDQAGSPWFIRFTVPNAAQSYLVIENSRNSAGMVVERRTNALGANGYTNPTIHFPRDRFGRLTTIQARQGANQLYQQSLAYAENGTVTSLTEQFGAATAPTQTTTYTYDGRHQLLRASQTGGVNYQGTFSYTRGGRMQSATVTATGAQRVPVRDVTHAYEDASQGGDPQRLTALHRSDGSSLASYAYDNAGNMTSRNMPDGTTLTQRWDGTRLRTVSRPGGEREVYFYDGATRVAAARYSGDGDLTEVRRWFGAVEVRYIPGAAPGYREYVQLGGETVARIDGPANAFAVEYYVSSPQGHQVLALDAATGAPTRQSSYGPFGEVLTHTVPDGTPTDKYTRQFNDKDYDPTGGLHHYGHRYYDPLALQWISADPKYRFAPDADRATPRRANLYTFAMNNPVSFVDPDGLDSNSVLNRAASWFQSNFEVEGPKVMVKPKGAEAGPGLANKDAKLVSAQLGSVRSNNGWVNARVGSVTVGTRRNVAPSDPKEKFGGTAKLQVEGAAVDVEARIPLNNAVEAAFGMEQSDPGVQPVVYGRGRVLGGSVRSAGRSSAYVANGQVGVGFRFGNTDIIVYGEGQFLGTSPVAGGIMIDNVNLYFDPIGPWATPLGEWIGDQVYDGVQSLSNGSSEPGLFTTPLPTFYMHP